MKKILFAVMAMIALAACTKNNVPDEPSQPTGGGEEPAGFTVALSYDSAANTVTALPSDSTLEYALFVWMKEDYILDYGDDFSDPHILESMQSYIDLCIDWDMAFPTFRGRYTMGVYEAFDQPYPGEEFIAMAAQFNTATNKVEGNVSHIFFVTKK